MKMDRNKMVFIAVITIVILFIGTYAFMMMEEDESENDTLQQTLIPELEEETETYSSKLDALNNLKEVKQTNAPSIYDEKLIDTSGFYDKDLPEKRKQVIVDSIYKANRIQYSERSSTRKRKSQITSESVVEIDSAEIKAARQIQAKELGLEHQLFFASSPKVNELSFLGSTDEEIRVVVDGDQVVKTNSRLRMRLSEDALINGKQVPKNTPIFGFISFQPNRTLIEIENIKHLPTSLKAFDLQDGSEGIYVENSFRAEATGEVLNDIIQDINVPGVPQVNGVSQVLRRRNRNVKVTVLNNYQLILKPSL